MKTLKKSLVLVLAFMMVIGVLAVAANADFVDIDQVTPEYREAIDVLSNLGLVNGNPDGTLTPKNTITRAELTKILFVAITGKTDKAAADLYAGYNTFDDVAADQWFAGYVNYAANKGWILGYGDGKFGPDDPVKGCDALVIILRVLGYGKYEELQGAGYEIKATEMARNFGLLKNTDALKVDYLKEGKREEVFEYLYRALDVETLNVPSSTETESARYYYGTGPDDYIQGYTGTGRTLRDNFADFELAELQGIVAASKSTDPECVTKVGKDTVPVTVLVDNTVLVNVDRPADEVGKTVNVRYNAKDVDGKTLNDVAGVEVVSVEVKLDKALTSAKADKKELEKYEVADSLLVVNTKTHVIEDETTMADLVVKDTDVIAAGTYYGLVDEETDVTTLYAVVKAQKQLGLFPIQITKNADGDLCIEEGPTLEELAEYGFTFNPEITEPGLYAVLGERDGYYMAGKVVEADFTGKVTNVARKDGKITGITVDGKSYEVWKDTDEVAVSINNKLGDPQSVAVGTEYDFYLYDGKVLAVTKPDAIYGANEPEPDAMDFDGFAYVNAAQAVIEYKGPEGGDAFLGEDADPADYSVKYAKVKAVLSEGKEGLFDLEVKTEDKKVDGETVTTAYVEVDGEKVVLYQTNEVPTESVVSIDAEGFWGYKLNGNTIELYAIDKLGVAGKEEYALGEAGDDVAKNGTTLKVDGTSYVVSKADFVGFDAKGKAVFFTGTANIPGDSVATEYAILKTVTADDKSTTTVEFVWGGAFTTAGATANAELVYIDASAVSESLDADGNAVYTYTGVKSNNTTITLTSGEALAETGFYTYKSDNTVDAYAETQPATVVVELDPTGEYILIDGVYYSVSGIKVAPVAGEFKAGATIAYVVDKDGAPTDAWVTVKAAD